MLIKPDLLPMPLVFPADLDGLTERAIERIQLFADGLFRLNRFTLHPTDELTVSDQIRVTTDR